MEEKEEEEEEEEMKVKEDKMFPRVMLLIYRTPHGMKLR